MLTTAVELADSEAVGAAGTEAPGSGQRPHESGAGRPPAAQEPLTTQRDYRCVGCSGLVMPVAGRAFLYGAGRSSQLFSPLENTFYVLLMINNDHVFSDGYKKT